MKVLRTNLDQARAQYKALQYPGDLAANVLDRSEPQRVLEYGTHRRINRWLWAGAAVAATAAAIVVFVFNVRTVNTRINPDQIAMQPAYEDEVALGSIPVISTVDAMPTDMQLMPAAPDMSISMPSFSFSSEPEQQQQLPQQPQSTNTSTSTIEEAVL